MTLGQLLNARRTAAGKSLREIAEELEMDLFELSDVERDRGLILGQRHWKPLSEFLGNVTVEELQKASFPTS